MKEQILNRIVAIYNALDKISVSGKNNLVNLSGSMAVLEEVESLLNNCDITAKEPETK